MSSGVLRCVQMDADVDTDDETNVAAYDALLPPPPPNNQVEAPPPLPTGVRPKRKDQLTRRGVELHTVMLLLPRCLLPPPLQSTTSSMRCRTLRRTMESARAAIQYRGTPVTI